MAEDKENPIAVERDLLGSRARGVRFDREELADDDRRRVMGVWRRFEESDPGRRLVEDTSLARSLSEEDSRTVVWSVLVVWAVAVVLSTLSWVWTGGMPLAFMAACLPVLVAALAWTAVAWVFWDAYRDSPERIVDRMETNPRLATRRQVAASMGARAVMRDVVPAVLPAMLDAYLEGRGDKPMPWMAAQLVGESHRIRVWLDSERHVYILGPSRSGKTVCIVIPAVVEAPGFALVTSTRSDIIINTRLIRERGVTDARTGARFGGAGRVAIFDPEGIGGKDPETRHNLKWTPLMGCDDPTVAKRRAETLVAIGGFGGGSNNQEWGVSAGGFIQALLYAAAVSDLPIRSCYEWSISPEKAVQAAELIERHAPKGDMQQWADTLNALKTMDVKLRENQWMGVKNAFAILADPKVAERLNWTAHDPRLDDPKRMVMRGDTVYVLANPKRDGAGGSNAGMFVALLLDTFQEACQQLAMDPVTGPRRKIEPPARFILDELSNIEKWPGLRNAVTQGGGNGYELFMVEQARAMMQKDYGKEDEETIWNNSHRVLLSGETSGETLRWWQDQIGRVRRTRTERSWNPGQGLMGGVSERYETEDAVQPADLSRLPRGYMICYPLGAPAPAFCRTLHYKDRGWRRDADMLALESRRGGGRR